MLEAPKFNSESEEADWWASRAGSVQIAIRLPEADLAHARKLAARKGLGYQTFLKMIVHEGLAREARRARSS